MRNLVTTYFGPYKKSVAFIVLLVIIQVILQILIIISVRPFVNEAISDIDTELLIEYGTLLVAMIFFYALITIVVARMSARISAESVSRIREDMFKKILSLKRPRDSGANMSGLINRLVGDVNNIQEFITEFLSTGLYVPLLAAGVIISTMYIDYRLSISLLVSMAFMIWFIFVLSKKELKLRSKLQRLFDRTIHLFREILIGARTARSFEMEDTQHETFSENNQEYSDMFTGAAVKVSYIASSSSFLLIIGVFFFYFLFLNDEGVISASAMELVVFIQYIVLFINCASITPFIITTLPIVKSSFRRISKVMNSKSEASGLTIPSDYDGPLLSCSNGIVINSGEEVSLVGRTGAGKSEFIRSILRLDDAAPGTISFKGVDITELDPKLLRKSIAYAGSMAMVFRGTVRENIDAYRQIPEERLKEVFEAAKIGVDPDTRLERFGCNISMGQKQKISIARALASDADLYIFDDCFTELDPKTENEIVSNIRGMLKDKAVLFTTHQFRISPGSDSVSVMDSGSVIDTGSHDELLDRCDIYRRMYYAGGGIDG